MVEDLNEVLVRPATARDADAIAAVHVASLRQAYADVVPAEYLAGLDVAARAATWADRLTTPREGTRTWVAEEEGRVVAFASLGPSLDEDAERTTLQIHYIYLEPGSWGQGIARELMRTLLAEVPDGAAVTLWVPDVNERAAHFYRRNGFARDGVERLEDVGGTQLTEVRYRRG
ncbi:MULTISPECIES: GNAT family N-acetyltransferase [unclassified Actinotalea]|uniref:GNAT family N-acetyltransferase n=1 Tax=unclassified Actinotalea TaxID=2638618 RepID=UPI0015F734D4|nr:MULTISPECIES: GNAT family N-acetyltransferase [unclassified Actinotalea]